MEVKLINRQYHIGNQDNGIDIEIENNKNGDPEITIWTRDHKLEFVFLDSSPDVVRTVGEMLIAAADLAVDQEKNNRVEPGMNQ